MVRLKEGRQWREIDQRKAVSISLDDWNVRGSQNVNPNIWTRRMFTLLICFLLFLLSNYWKGLFFFLVGGGCPMMSGNGLKIKKRGERGRERERHTRNTELWPFFFFVLPNLPESLSLVVDRPPEPSRGRVVQLREQRHVLVLVGIGGKLHGDRLGGTGRLVAVEVCDGLFSLGPLVKPDKGNPSGKTLKPVRRKTQ